VSPIPVIPIPVIIDCDPGVDDAIALLLAFAAPDALEILAVTTTAGNVDGPLTARNARMIRQIAGREDVPVYEGAGVPLARPPTGASHFHGESGLGDLPVFEPAAPSAPGHAVDAIIALAMSRPAGTVRMAVTGPMTNLALALRKEPKLAGHLGPIVAMGGARAEGGNITASAEYNIWADPDAAAEVLAAGLDITLIGLDATHQVRAEPARVKALSVLRTPSGQAAHALLDFAYRTQMVLVGWDNPPLHDPCTIAFLLDPRLFETRPANIQVETASDLTRGHTAVELRVGERHPANARWAVRANAEGVFALIQDRLASR
jgi:purine nucleosidase